jgi:membrane-bound metal-dependent hydrolase YbcI (DUF457 family)
MIAWLIAIALLDHVRDRRLATVAGVVPDIDGFYILYNSDLYYEFHHTWGHSFLFALPLIILFTLFSKDRKRTFFASIAAFSLHLVADVVGSNWAIEPFYPISSLSYSGLSYFTNDFIYGIINPITALLAIFLIIMVIRKKEVSPFEFISPSLDQKLIGLYLYPFRYKCEECSLIAILKCDSCHRYICTNHVGSYQQWYCSVCSKKDS